MIAIEVSARTLIEGSFDASGVAELHHVYDVGLALGLPEQTVRLTIRRMQAAGSLIQEGRGRAGKLIQSEHGLARSRLDSRLVKFAFEQDIGEHPWDGRWRLYGFSIPESARTERDRLRSGLTSLGAAAVAPGLYMSPYDLTAELAVFTEYTSDQRLMTATSADLALPNANTPTSIAELLWPSAQTLAAYEPLAEILSDFTPTERADPVELTADALRLAEGFDRALTVDPLLPPELRPTEWGPSVLRSQFLAAWEALRAQSPDLAVFLER